MANPNPNMSGLTPFKKGHKPTNSGRKPSVLKKCIKDNGISIQDMEHAFRFVLGKSREDLIAIVNNPKESIILVSAAAAILKDISKGKMDNISTVMRKSNVDPEQSGSSDPVGGMGGADTSDHSQFHEYSFPESDTLP